MRRGRLILAGSGEFTAAMDDLDLEILAGLGKPRARVAVVPTASGLEDTPESWASRFCVSRRSWRRAASWRARENRKLSA